MTQPDKTAQMCCRSCAAPLALTVVDLGLSPLCQTVIRPDDAERGEPFYPLRAMVCASCWLVQVGDYVEPEGLFQRDYPYFSSFSDSWVDHARSYVDVAIDRLGLDGGSRVVEVGSNDGYLLQWFVAQGIPSLGVDPAQSVVEAAAARGVQTRTAFFGADVAAELVEEGWRADLVCGANVMAQVPDLNDFVAGLAALVADDGTVTIEFPHLVTLIDHTEFDTIYHEHFSYFSLVATETLFARHGLRVTDVEQLPTHGGSLRIWARLAAGDPEVGPAVTALREDEIARGVTTPAYYTAFTRKVQRVRRELLEFLFAEAEAGRTVAGYGAPGKGNTLLNYCGIRPDLLAFTVDRNPAKQDVLLPGSRIPVHAPEHLSVARPDTILILPWNLRTEIAAQLAHTAEWGANLAVPIPSMKVWPAGIVADLSRPGGLLAVSAEILDLPRSLTGEGVRETLRRLADHVPLELREVPTGTPALDWTVPQEWRFRSARLTGPDGEVVVDAADHPLHVLGYSHAVDMELDLAELQDHLHSLPEQPDLIPYRTSYYTPRWGFCLPDRVRRDLAPGTYRARIDADLVDGHMTYGELVLPGESEEEVLVTSHVCHPGMANDNVSGNVVAAGLAQVLMDRPRRHTWRFLWMPGTIGELTWLAMNRGRVDRIVAGVVLAGVGDRGPLTYKRSRRGNAVMDRVAAHVLAERGRPDGLVDFSPWGYAERQFGSLGFDLGVGRLSRTEHATYPEYHTSADDLAFISADALAEAVDVLARMAEVLDRNTVNLNLKPDGEPRLGPRGLYPSMGGPAAEQAQLALLWVLNASDGATDLLEVARRSGIPFDAIATAADSLNGTDLLQRADKRA